MLIGAGSELSPGGEAIEEEEVLALSQISPVESNKWNPKHFIDINCSICNIYVNVTFGFVLIALTFAELPVMGKQGRGSPFNLGN